MSNSQSFADLVDLAMAQDAVGSNMRPVVEKELFHYEIFAAMDKVGLLKDLVFQGGTSLRLCRGSDRFSEDLDFAGGKSFDFSSMREIKSCIEAHINKKYGLAVRVKEPKASERNDGVTVDKWWVSIETSPGMADIPRQKIKLEIANVPAYTQELTPLLLNYDALRGARPILVNAESINEILADKIVALPTSISKYKDGAMVLTDTKIRYRDIWDIAWLRGQGAKLDGELVIKKLNDYGIARYPELLDKTIERLPLIVASDMFKKQMGRFIKSDALESRFSTPGGLEYFVRENARVFEGTKAHLVAAPTH